jgi:hypothetical protein
MPVAARFNFEDKGNAVYSIHPTGLFAGHQNNANIG